MGLFFRKDLTDQLRKEIHDKGGKISVWKFLKLEGNQLSSPFEYFTKWKPGLNKAGRARITSRHKLQHNQITPAEVRQNRVNHGFHVYTSYHRARHNSYGDSAIVRFEAHADDLIAAGNPAGKSLHAVFSQLTLPESVLKRILKKHGSQNIS